jgi:hypothetical protein
VGRAGLALTHANERPPAQNNDLGPLPRQPALAGAGSFVTGNVTAQVTLAGSLFHFLINVVDVRNPLEHPIEPIIDFLPCDRIRVHLPFSGAKP